MLRNSLVSVVLLASAAGQAQAGWADGLFDELSRDFGSVPHGQVVTHPFRLVNNTKETIRISNVRVSCGQCTSAQALQTVLAPGEETAIYAQMDTGRFYNTKSVTIYVQFDQPRFEEVRLWIQANSRSDVSFNPDSLSFGKIKRGTEANSKMNITFYGDGQTKILEAKCDSNYIQAAFKEIRRGSGEVLYEITAKLRGDTPAGKWFTDIWLKTNNATLTRLRVPLTVEVESALSISPNTVTLGKVKAGTETDRKVILRGVKAFRIVGITGTDNQVSVRETSNESKTVHVLTVTLKPNEAGNLNRIIRVQTDLKNGGDIEIAAQAQVVP
jgi:hypothetical protein